MSRRKTLTDIAIANLPIRAKAYTQPDPELSGHYVRVRPSGSKTFVVVARNPSRRQEWHTIGATSLYSVEEAREKARDAAKAIIEGKSRKAPDTFEVVAEDWYKQRVAGRGLVSAPWIRSHLDRILLPAWRGQLFAGIRRGDVNALLNRVAETTTPIAADAVLATIRNLCGWYQTQDEDYTSPIVKGMRKAELVRRARILDDEELRAIWKAAAANGVFGAYVRVALLTGQRREKVASMRWDDVVDGEWHMPIAARQKGTAGHLVLPEAAIAIIESQPRFASNPYVFAGRGKDHLAGISKRKAQLTKIAGVDDWTVHDLRRTARSLMSRAGVRPDIAEKVLGHVQGGVLGIYDRHDYREEKAHALRALAGLIEGIINPQKNVVPILSQVSA